MLTESKLNEIKARADADPKWSAPPVTLGEINALVESHLEALRRIKELTNEVRGRSKDLIIGDDK